MAARGVHGDLQHEKLTEQAVNFEEKIPVRNDGQARHDQDPERFFTESFWNRRPDGVEIDKAKYKVLILEFKSSIHGEESFFRNKKSRCELAA